MIQPPQKQLDNKNIKMAATTRKCKSACTPAKSKKSKAVEAEGANNGVFEAKAKANVEAVAKTGASEGGGVITPSSPANNAGPPPVSAAGGRKHDRIDDDNLGNEVGGR